MRLINKLINYGNETFPVWPMNRQFMTLKHHFGPLLIWTSLRQLWLPFKSFLSKSIRMLLFHVRLMSTLISYGSKTFSVSFIGKRFKQQKELICNFF